MRPGDRQGDWGVVDLISLLWYNIFRYFIYKFLSWSDDDDDAWTWLLCFYFIIIYV